MKISGITTLFILILTNTIFADSDGYYCACKNVLAYELKWTTENINPDNEHLLRIIRFDSIMGINKAIDIKLPDFEVHGINCTEKSIQLLSWDTLYIISLDTTNIGIFDRIPIFQNKKERSCQGIWDSLNLGHLSRWSHAGETELNSDDPNYTYILKIEKYNESTQDDEGYTEMIYHHTTSTIFRIDKQGNKDQKQLLFKGVKKEPIH